MSQTKRRLLRVITRFLLSAVILVAAGVIYVVLVRTAPLVQTSDTLAVPPIAVLAAQRVPVQRQWRGYGTVEAIDSADVPARVTATVEYLPDDILSGTRVTRGQLLVQLDDSDFRRQVEIAQQNLADLDSQMALQDVQKRQLATRLALESEDIRLAEDELKRIQQLLQRQAANPRDVDMAKRALIAAQIAQVATSEAVDSLGPRRRQLEAQRVGQDASLRLAQESLRRCRVTSPIDGVLQWVDVEVGESLASGQRVARVVNLSRMEVPLRLPAAARRAVAVGDQTQLEVTNRTGVTWSARISRIAPEDDTSTRTVTVYIEVNQSPHVTAGRRTVGVDQAMLVPGMFVAGVVASGEARPRWVIPRRAVQAGRILTVDGGVIQSRPVHVDYVLEGRLPDLGLPDDQWVVLDPVVAALRDGELVVVNGSTSMRAGQAVAPVVLTAASASPDPGAAP